MTPESVQALLTDRLSATAVEVTGDGHHFYARIASPRFEGLGLLARHRLVKDAVKPEIDSGELHALSLEKTLTPAEWAERVV
ncbi:BolA/IbaG family iron-sulfur metabolism protein [Iodobacter sp. LRB]|jgi:acid stress-induced BolA-like protein IbaG/YrbA|uniref:Acid stress-induced BolA-like protein IbaG/YrbA n=1 Tax=Iodobacter fluviatilis TaxID=537 RepID=A0A377SSD9_9NEIS|nr:MULTISPECIES: BolA/IbaG family iron-sulfur metabolism protein [Iodobacter]PHV02683.1 BolA family transcriptional regulator [Iodobacter sp. BJB302]TCU85610.1 acid stress-induced BolA-like protein IbaG/YrbA [Iodobacter fluviatilis]STR44942.1 Predicted transcriptional regulator, BolA superfamily [Iodobacter fluviatilis]